jgi:hypothetical protein
MDLPRINYAQTDARDATVIDQVRQGVLEHLTRPKEFPRRFHGEYGHPVGYQFSWGQIIELPTAVPNPATERYEGLTWSLFTTLPWAALRGHLQSLNRPLSHLLRSLKDDSANGIADYVPPWILCDGGRAFETVRFITLSTKDSIRARSWLADVFLPNQLFPAIEAYQAELHLALECTFGMWWRLSHGCSNDEQ